MKWLQRELRVLKLRRQLRTWRKLAVDSTPAQTAELDANLRRWADPDRWELQATAFRWFPGDPTL